MSKRVQVLTCTVGQDFSVLIRPYLYLPEKVYKGIVYSVWGRVYACLYV